MSTSDSTSKGYINAETGTIALASVAAVGAAGVYWWSSGKIRDLEKDNAKLCKRIDRLEARLEEVHKQVVGPSSRVNTALSRHGSTMEELRSDVDRLYVTLDSLNDTPPEPEKYRPKGKILNTKRDTRRPVLTHTKTSRSGYGDENSDEYEDTQSLESSEEIDYDALYAAEEKKEKKSKSGRKRS